MSKLKVCSTAWIFEKYIDEKHDIYRVKLILHVKRQNQWKFHTELIHPLSNQEKVTFNLRQKYKAKYVLELKILKFISQNTPFSGGAFPLFELLELTYLLFLNFLIKYINCNGSFGSSNGSS